MPVQTLGFVLLWDQRPSFVLSAFPGQYRTTVLQILFQKIVVVWDVPKMMGNIPATNPAASIPYLMSPEITIKRRTEIALTYAKDDCYVVSRAQSS